MGVSEVLFLAIRWLHNLSAVTWVGGGIFYLLILRPRYRRAAANGGADDAGRDFRSLVHTAMGVLLITGAVLTFNRVTSGFVGVPYVVVLAVKVALAFYMFYLVRFLRPRREAVAGEARPAGMNRLVSAASGSAAVVVVGVIVLLLADILGALFEQGLKG